MITVSKKHVQTRKTEKICVTDQLARENRGYNIGLAGCGMGHKIEGCGIREIMRVGYGIISWWDRDALISVGGMWDSFDSWRNAGFKRQADL